MVVVDVALGERSYPIFVEPGCRAQIGRWLVSRGFRRVHVVSQQHVWALHGPSVIAGLDGVGLWEPEAVSLVPDGEAAKTWAVAGRVLDDLVTRRLERGDIVIAVGGGIVGDLAGFVAAVYLRGIAFVQVPTSLLAQVDASVGGKTGLNHPLGKNLIGAFHQPAAVFADPELLRTLPSAELRAGLAECVKHGVIASAEYVRFIADNVPAIQAVDAAVLSDLVAESCRIKAAVVAADERETGRRAVLNFGHTVAHALEAVAEFSWRHGEAVAVGTVAALRISERLGLCSPEVSTEIADVLDRCGLPVRLPPVSAAALLDAATRDKKRSGGRQTWVLAREPGDVVLRNDVPDELVSAVLQQLGAAP